MPAGWSEDPFQGGRLLVVSSDGGWGKGTLWGLFNRDTNPIYEAPPSRPSHLPKASSLKAITLGTRISTCEFFWGGHRHSDHSAWTLKFIVSLSVTSPFFFLFLLWTILKVFIEFVTIFFLFQVLVFWPWGMWDFSSLTRDWTRNPCTGRRSLNHWTVREVPLLFPLLTCFLRPDIPAKPITSTSLPCLL